MRIITPQLPGKQLPCIEKCQFQLIRYFQINYILPFVFLFRKYVGLGHFNQKFLIYGAFTISVQELIRLILNDFSRGEVRNYRGRGTYP